jgi:IS605 OrfB family transposase
MLVVQKNKLKVDRGQYHFLRELTHHNKSLYNVYLYESKQHFQQTGQFLNYTKAWNNLKQHYNYKLLPSDVAQQTMKIVERSWRSFFGLLKKKKAGNYNRPAHEPHFLPKDGHLVCIFPIREGRCKNEFKLFVPKEWRHKYKFTKLTVPVPPNVKGHKIKEVRILPRVKGTYFEIEFVYEVQEEKSNVDKKKVLAIDTGVNNFATCLDSSGRSFILDGRSMKSINRLYNKKRSYYHTVLSKQGHKTSKRLQLLGYKNNKRLGEYLNQYVNFIITYCLTQGIGKVVVGEGHLAQDGTRLGDANNQNFVMLPFGKFCWKLQSKCERYGIQFETREESYTSKCDHLAGETMTHHDKYLGTRRPRGLFRSSTGIVMNADVHGALGIMLKSGSGKSLRTRLSRGKVTLPWRIRLNKIQQTSSMRLVQEHFLDQSKPQGLPCGM